MSKNVEVPDEKISEMNVLVYKTLVDPSTVKLIGEREKVKLFTRMGLLRPKQGDIRFESLEQLYEPYFTVNGRYFIDYYRKHVYTLNVEDDVSELLIFDRVFPPEMPKLAKIRGKGREVRLEAEQRIVKENSAYTILDKKGNEVELDQFSTAPAEAEPATVLAEAGQRMLNLEISADKAIEIFRSKLVQRPHDVTRVNSEVFEVSEFNLVYVPIYHVTYRNVKTEDKKSLTVDGVTSQLLSKRIEREAGTPKKLCSKCGQLNEENTNFCKECGQPL